MNGTFSRRRRPQGDSASAKGAIQTVTATQRG